MLLAAVCAFGVVIGWIVQSARSSKVQKKATDEIQGRLDQAVRQRDHVSIENESLKKSLQAQIAVVEKHNKAASATRTEIDSLREKINSLNKNLFAASSERDDLKSKVTEAQAALATARMHTTELEGEFEKTRKFLETQLETAKEERSLLERKIDDAKSESESLNNLLSSARSEHVSVNNMLAAAQARLKSLDAVEEKLIALEADNAELKHEAQRARRQADALQRDADEMEALKEQNRELISCLESMENSRKQYEADAQRFRSQYEQSEKVSETLRFKLGDIEKNWAEMQRASQEARAAQAKFESSVPPFGLREPQGEADDLTEIVGVGKVFQELLNRLGVFHFRQIAAFGPAEIARINSELKEFKGRIEHDDWIGQAKELHFRKFGNSGTH